MCTPIYPLLSRFEYIDLGMSRANHFRPQNCPFTCGDLDLHLIHGSLDPLESTSKLHLDRLSRFCRVTVVTDRQTDRPTVRQTTQ